MKVKTLLLALLFLSAFLQGYSQSQALTNKKKSHTSKNIGFEHKKRVHELIDELHQSSPNLKGKAFNAEVREKIKSKKGHKKPSRTDNQSADETTLIATSSLTTTSSSTFGNLVSDKEEYLALKALFEATDGENWINNEGWPYLDWPNPDSVEWQDFESWYGVNVNEGDITGLYFEENNLIGNIPEEFGDLLQLNTVDINYNQIGSLPTSIGNLANLFNLYIQYNQLTSIPSSIGNLASLQIIYLSGNQLTELPNEFRNLNSLRFLYLKDNYFEIFPNEIVHLSDLRHLNFENNQIKELPAEIGNITTLSHLNFISNQLSQIPLELNNLVNLSELILKNNHLTSFPDDLSGLSNLYILNLSGNRLEVFPQSITTLYDLGVLYFDNNEISSIPSEIANLEWLTGLSLSGNNFTEFPMAVTDMIYLFDLYLDRNEISNVPEEIGNMGELTYLFLAENNLSSLPSSLQTLPYLYGLKIGGNAYEGFPTEVLQLGELSYLDISNSGLESLPTTDIVNAFPYLEYFDIYGNKLNFDDLEQLFNGPGDPKFPDMLYSPQANTPLDTSIYVIEGSDLNFLLEMEGEQNVYTWEKLNESDEWTQVSTEEALTIPSLSKADQGQYRLKVTNNWVEGLELYTDPVEMDVYYHSLVKTTSVQVEGIKDTSLINDLVIGDRYSSYSYLDGLGRMLQRIEEGISPSGSDAVKAINYEERLQVKYDHLPYTINNEKAGAFRSSALNGEQQGFYSQPPVGVAADQKPYSVRNTEESPSARTTQYLGPGENWHTSNATKNLEYQSNAIEEGIIAWQLIEEAPGVFALDGALYPSNSLHKRQYTNEEGQEVISFTDHWGSKIAIKQKLNETEWATSYFLYDYRGNIVMVVPPEAVDKITEDVENQFKLDAATVEKYCFQYEYDHEDRVIAEHIPQGGTNVFIYDKWDRLVLSQDEMQRANNQWSYAKFDALDRPIETGLYTDARDAGLIRAEVESLQDQQEYESYDPQSASLYTNNSFPQQNTEALKNNYYDDYFSLSGQQANGLNYSATHLANLPSIEEKIIKGLQTASRTKILDTEEWLWQMNYYDEDGQSIQTASEIHGGGIKRASLDISYNGELNVTKHTLYEGDVNKEQNIQKRYTYDHAGRLIDTYHQVNTQPEVHLSRLTYNERGETIKKELHIENSVAMQVLDYSYNNRGWLTGINKEGTAADKFLSLKYAYETPLSGITHDGQFDGNISGQAWANGFEAGAEKAYTYQYDAKNQITEAQQHEKNTSWASTAANSLDNLAYDKNGNIKTLNRTDGQGGSLDQLDYTYDGNQLLKIDDTGDVENGFKDGNIAGDDYEYDASGRLISDKNKGITSITYYHTHHPKSITFDDGSTIEYQYTATGERIGMQITEAGESTPSTDYQYYGAYTFLNGQPQTLFTEEGRLVNRNSEWVYEYDLKDHLGNTRVSFTTQPATETTTATMETTSATMEESSFLKLEDSRIGTTTSIDHTGNSESPKVSRLNGGQGIKEGPGKMLKVMPGDTIRLKVYAKYLELGELGDDVNPMAVMQALNPAGGISGGEKLNPKQRGMDRKALAGLFSNADRNEAPKAYMNYQLFDQAFNQKYTGHVQVSKAAAITKENPNGEHEELQMEVIVEEPGYMFTYLSHEEETNTEIYFDDYSVEQSHGYITQVQDYYPFGMVQNQNLVDNELLNRYLYQGKEYEEKAGVYDFHARMYDPSSGRFMSVDPMASKYANLSPYTGMGNNPMAIIDPTGGDMVPIGGGTGPQYCYTCGLNPGSGGGTGGGTGGGGGSAFNWVDDLYEGTAAGKRRDYFLKNSFEFEGKHGQSSLDYREDLILARAAANGQLREAWLAKQQSYFYNTGNRYEWYEVIEGGTAQASRIKVKEPINMFDYFPGGKYFWKTHMGRDLKSLIPRDHQPGGETIMNSGEGGDGSSTTADHAGIIVDPITRALPDKWSARGVFSLYNQALGLLDNRETWPIERRSGDTTFYEHYEYGTFNVGDTLFLINRVDYWNKINDTTKQYNNGNGYWPK